MRAVPDPRCGRKTKHDYAEEMVCLVIGYLVGRTTIRRSALRAVMEKVKNFRAPMVMNVIDAATRLVVAQLPIQNKDCEITAIPELLKLLDIRGSTVTIDAIGTQTEIMEQILEGEGHFVLMVKRNQPQSYDEIMKYFKEMSEDWKKMKKDGNYQSKNNLALIRKFAYNILKIAMISKSCGEIMTEAMDEFCDDPSLIEKYVFNGIESFY